MSVNWVLVDRGPLAPDIQVGDLVSGDAGGLPTYRVLKLQDGRAWLREAMTGADVISPLSRFHWKIAGHGS